MIASCLHRGLMGLAAAALVLTGCGAPPWNNPYPKSHADEQVLYSAFEERPKHLDPGRSYSAAEYKFLAQIYEPLFQYHLLKRPYVLEPLSAAAMPQVRYLGENGEALPDDAANGDIAFSEYLIDIKPGIRYQPHPALAKDEAGRYRYHQLSAETISTLHTLNDFAHSGSRELLAADFVYQIKRLADPKTHSPIAGVMADYIEGLPELAEQLKKAREGNPKGYVDLREYDLPGAQAIGQHRLRLRIKGKYPQLQYWLAMPFFAPMPWEADVFYAQQGLDERNISLHWYPIGTGPYMLSENNPNLRMVLSRNPNYHGEPYPSEGAPGDAEAGLLADAGKTMPFIDRAIYSLEKESIPYWTKFLQGYFDASGISSDSFDQAIQYGAGGETELTTDMQDKDIRLVTAVQTSTFYFGFNMLDDVVGGDSERARLLRRAIAIAFDIEELIAIFANGRGIPAQGAIPPQIFGHREGQAGMNPYVYDWVNGRPQRKSLDDAKAMLAQAGYPGGVDKASGKQLVLNFEAVGSGPDAKARLNWYRKQFAKLGIDLVIRNTDYNRFQQKMLNGQAQIFGWGWNADYPDPENFLFLLYGPNSKVKHRGENAANYNNPRFNELFEKMKNMDNSPERQAVIDEMVDIARRDGPWLWGYHPKAYSLHHAWLSNIKPNLMANNTLKYKRVKPALREAGRSAWNQPILWPLWGLLALLLVSIVPALMVYLRRQRASAL